MDYMIEWYSMQHIYMVFGKLKVKTESNPLIKIKVDFDILIRLAALSQRLRFNDNKTTILNIKGGNTVEKRL